jgi:hypothetical protein
MGVAGFVLIIDELGSGRLTRRGRMAEIRRGKLGRIRGGRGRVRIKWVKGRGSATFKWIRVRIKWVNCGRIRRARRVREDRVRLCMVRWGGGIGLSWVTIGVTRYARVNVRGVR